MIRSLSQIGCLTACVAWFPLQAQEEAGTEAEGIVVRLLAVARHEGMENVVVQSGKKRSHDIAVTTHGLSEPIPVQQRKIVLGLDLGKKRQAIKPIARIKLPDQGKKFVILMVPNAKGYKCKPVRMDVDKFKGGDTMFFNTAAIPVGGSLGGTKFTSRPGAYTVVTPKVKGKQRWYQVKFFCRDRGQSKIFSNTRWPVDQFLRSYVFFFNNEKTGELSYRAVDEVIPRD